MTIKADSESKTCARIKGRWWRRLLRSLIGILLLFIATCFIFDHFVQLRMNDKELTGFFNKHNIKAVIGYYTSGGRKLRYISIGNDSLPTLLFIHGSPASLSLYKDYYKDPVLQQTFHMLAADRPGYGYSGFGNPEPSIQKQAAMIRPLLDSLTKARHPVIVMGGSYGSSIACRLAMDYPHLVDGLVLLSPSVAPGEEKIYWFTPMAESPLVNWFVPRMFQSANTEKIHHKQELRKMLPYWKNIRIPVVYLQGQKDELIYTSNALFAQQHLVNAPYLDIQMLKGRPHFFSVSEKPLIKKNILKLYGIVKAK